MKCLSRPNLALDPIEDDDQVGSFGSLKFGVSSPTSNIVNMSPSTAGGQQKRVQFKASDGR